MNWSMVLKSYQMYSFPYTPKFSINSVSISSKSRHSKSRTSEVLFPKLRARFVDSKPFQLALSLFLNWGGENSAEQCRGGENAAEQHREISLRYNSGVSNNTNTEHSSLLLYLQDITTHPAPRSSDHGPCLPSLKRYGGSPTLFLHIKVPNAASLNSSTTVAALY
jgi:hypothetical protein